MPSLFGGVENFTPAFTGQQLAIQAGQGAGQSISRGMQVAQRGKQMDFERDRWDDMKKQNEAHSSWLNGILGEGDWAGEAGPATPWK